MYERWTRLKGRPKIKRLDKIEDSTKILFRPYYCRQRKRRKIKITFQRCQHRICLHNSFHVYRDCQSCHAAEFLNLIIIRTIKEKFLDSDVRLHENDFEFWKTQVRLFSDICSTLLPAVLSSTDEKDRSSVSLSQ